MIRNVSNVGEAVLLATRLQADEGFDWFRGQANAEWPLVASICRLQSEDYVAAKCRYDHFAQWSTDQPELEPLIKIPDYLMAVAQHYGVPTPFLDFTTRLDVAAFFATHPLQPPEPSQCGCILCLRSHDIAGYWERVFDGDSQPPRRPEPLRLPVPSLWRLQAQAGVFLWCPFTNFEDVYLGITRIVFPLTDVLRTLNNADIYPIRKSQLEIILDHYFASERLDKATEAALSTFPHMSRLEFSFGGHRWLADAIRPDAIRADCSWSTPELETWHPRVCQSDSIVIPSARHTVCLRVDGHLGTDEARALYAAQILEMLSSMPFARRRVVEWHIACDDMPDNTSVENVLAHLWDGMRYLPYGDADISHALANSLLLHSLRFGPGRREKAAQACFGDSVIEVELSGRGSDYQRAFVGTAALRSAFSDRLPDVLVNDYEEALSLDPYHVLSILWAPEVLFDFRKFASLLARQVIPCEVLSAGGAPFFSPAEITSFGLA